MNSTFYRTMIVGMSALFGLMATSAIALTADTYWIQPVYKFVWRESGTEAQCNGTVLRRPEISTARVVDFAADAAVSINSYDYYNQAVTVGSALRQYFTAAGSDAYVAELNRTGSPMAIRSNFVTQTAYKVRTPNIKEEGYIGNRHYWNVEVPLVVFRESNAETTNQMLLLTMLIVELKPSPANPNGIGIDSIRVTPMIGLEG